MFLKNKYKNSDTSIYYFVRQFFLKSMSSKSAIWFFLGTVSVDILFPLNGIFSLVSLCALHFVVVVFKTGHVNLIMWYLWKSDSPLSSGFTAFCFISFLLLEAVYYAKYQPA